MLARGKLVAVPAETVYGLAADATNPAACAAIFTAKKRPADDPLIVHVSSLAQAGQLAEWNPLAKTLAKRFWPGPLTLVLPRKSCVPNIVTSGLTTVAIRMPAHPLFKKVLQAAGVPLAAPSANLFGYVSPTRAAHVLAGEAFKKIRTGRANPAILDGGECPIGVESTIVRVVSQRSIQILRPGAISREQIKSAIAPGVRVTRPKPARAANVKPTAPGQLERHYSPQTATILRRVFPKKMSARDAWVHFRSGDTSTAQGENHFVLSPQGDGETAAKSLYRLLRDLDGRGYRAIQLQQVPSDNPWAETLNDRMRRAAAKS